MGDTILNSTGNGYGVPDYPLEFNFRTATIDTGFDRKRVIMAEIPKHFTASAIVRRDDMVLLLWHTKLGMWLYPGGHVEENETPDDAILREVKEETGLLVEFDDVPDTVYASPSVHVLHTPAIIFDEQIGAGEAMHRHIDLVYLCHPISGTAVTLAEKEAESYGWFSKDDIAELNTPPNLKKFLLSIL